MEQKLKKLGKEELRRVILKLAEILSAEQRDFLDALLEGRTEGRTAQEVPASRMSGELVEEKMGQVKLWMEQIDDGDLYLEAEEYEDYSDHYWDRDWITEYHDSQGVGDKLMYMIQFAKDCVDDRRYQEANFIYGWLWEMQVSVESEGEIDPVDFGTLAEEGIARTDLKQVMLLSLYAQYQAREAEDRAEGIYLYFSHDSFRNLRVEEMFHAGRESLTGTEQFLEDWIALLKTKGGDMEGRLLQEALLYSKGTEGLIEAADESCGTHPVLYLTVMRECDKAHDYGRIEEIGDRALGKIDSMLRVRSEVALMEAYAASCLSHREKVMECCWEAFRSNSTVRNFLRLFGMEEMAHRYGTRGKELLSTLTRGVSEGYFGNTELRQNIISEQEYHALRFYMGDFEKAKQASENPKGSLGWSSRFIRSGIRLFLLYLYGKPLPSKAAVAVAQGVAFPDDAESRYEIDFEREIREECRREKTGMFWNYFRRWKQCFPMEHEERKRYADWAQKTACDRADAIVGGQHRKQYWEAAALLAMIAEVKEDMGEQGEKRRIFEEYKGKFPRHTSFQGELRGYFGLK